MDESKTFPLRWTFRFGLVALLVLLTAVLLTKMGLQWLENRPGIQRQSLYRVVMEGDVAYLDQAGMARFQQRLPRLVNDQRGSLDRDARRFVAGAVARAFQPAYAAIPRYLDWYYSLPGEYARLGHLVGGDATAFLSRRLEWILFTESGAAARFQWLSTTLEKEMNHRLRNAGKEVLERAHKALAVLRVATAPERMKNAVAGELLLDLRARETLEVDSKLMERQLAALGMGVGVNLWSRAAGVQWVKQMVKTVARGRALQTASAALGRVAGRTLVARGGVLAAAGGGALLCAPGGPLAATCGLLAGVAAWVATDEALLQLEQWLHRDEFQKELEASLRQQQRLLTQHLTSVYEHWLNQRLDSFVRMTVNEGRQGSALYPTQGCNGELDGARMKQATSSVCGRARSDKTGAGVSRGLQTEEYRPLDHLVKPLVALPHSVRSGSAIKNAY